MKRQICTLALLGLLLVVGGIFMVAGRTPVSETERRQLAQWPQLTWQSLYTGRWMQDAEPFLTDCNTLYIGGRKNALDHLDSAYQNGFVPYATGCQVIIADGLKGTDEVDVPVEGGEYVKTAKIGRAVMDADIVISLTHFKCHEEAGVGGAMKNVGMGCGSGAGKREMHSDGRPLTDREKCVGCGACAKICAHNGPKLGQKDWESHTEQVRGFDGRVFDRDTVIPQSAGAMLCCWCDRADADGPDGGQALAGRLLPVIAAFGQAMRDWRSEISCS